jgi:hypothetical protein
MFRSYEFKIGANSSADVADDPRYDDNCGVDNPLRDPVSILGTSVSAGKIRTNFLSGILELN